MALKQAGIESAIVDEVAEAMVRDGHSAGYTDKMTSGQVAKFLWLSFISHDRVVATESLLLSECKRQPQQHGEVDGDTIVQYLGRLVRSETMAAGVLALEVDAGTRQVRVDLQDGDPVLFYVQGRTYPLNQLERLVIGGTFLYGGHGFLRSRLVTDKRQDNPPCPRLRHADPPATRSSSPQAKRKPSSRAEAAPTHTSPPTMASTIN